MTKRQLNYFVAPKRQQGAVLVISLLILIVLTLIGLTGMQTTTMEERMAGNMRDRYVAFQAAELARSEALDWLDARTARPAASPCTGPPCDVMTLNAHDFLSWDHTSWTNNGRAYTGTVAEVNTQPRFVVEEHMPVEDSGGLVLGQVPKVRWFYRVTSRGTGLSDEAQVIIQASYARRY